MVKKNSIYQEYIANVSRYYNEVTPLYLKYFSSTLQAIKPHTISDNKASNQFWFARMPITNHSRVLDCGCGVAGPALDLIDMYPDIHVDGVTLSPVQAVIAQNEIIQHAVGKRINIIVADYHDIPCVNASYDLVFFLESLGYAYDLQKVLMEVRRVLVSGGSLYIKDLFVPARDLNQEERLALAEFNRIYHYRTLQIDYLLSVLQILGFKNIESSDLMHITSTKQIHQAMFATDHSGQLKLNPFGKYHRPNHSVKANPVVFMDIKASL